MCDDRNQSSCCLWTMEISERRYEGAFWGDEIALYLDWVVSCMSLYIYQNSLTCTLKIYAYKICKFYLSKKDLKY